MNFRLCFVQAMKSAPAKRGPAVIRVRHRRLQQALDCDVAVCGGTLGLLLALALQVSLKHLSPAHQRLVHGRELGPVPRYHVGRVTH